MKLWIWIVLLVASSASAHTLSVSRVALSDVEQNAASIRIDLPLRELAAALPFDADGDGQLRWREVLAAQPQFQLWLQRRLVFRDAEACTLQDGNLAMAAYDDGPALAWSGQLHCGDTIDRLLIESRLLFDVDARHRTLVHMHGTRGDQVIVLSADQPNGVIGNPSGTSVFASFLFEGVHHILIGYDHLAFLVCLLLVVVLHREKGQWSALPHLRESALAAALLVTAFTLAHSLTLSASALGWAVPASGWVEPAIALSIVLAAVNNLLPLVHRRAWIFAFGFGLVHGYGFAGALSELGLPVGAELTALVAFNLGVELGQLTAVVVVLPSLHLLARWPAYPTRMMAPASLLVGALGCYWLVQRLV